MSDFDFDLSAADPAGRTAEFHIPHSTGGVLLIRYAGSENEAFVNATAKLAGKRTEAQRQAAKANAAVAVKISLDDDRKSFPGAVVYGWREIKNKNGEEVEFSVKACRAYLAALPVWIMQRLSNKAANPSVFLDQEDPLAEPTDEEIEAQSGN